MGPADELPGNASFGDATGNALTVSYSAPLRLICDPDAKDRLTILATQRPGDLANGLELLIGPEGGWSPEEMALAARHGVLPVRFGDRVLRTETAGIAMVSALSAALGWV